VQKQSALSAATAAAVSPASTARTGLSKNGSAASKLSIFNFTGQLSFYAAYHSNSTNQLIHFVFVPLILFTAMIWGATAGPLLPTPSFVPKIAPDWPVVLNVPAFAALLAGSYYITLDPVAGIVATALLVVGWLSATHLCVVYPGVAWKYATVLHVVGWIAQFVGHGVFEGRRPALLDNLFQSLVLAPFFVLEELLFKVGYRPDLHRQLQYATSQRILKSRSSK